MNGRTIVSDDFDESAVSEDEIAHNELADGPSGFTTQLLEFWVVTERATSLDDILEAFGRWEVHGVDIDFGKEGSRCSDDRGDKDVLGTTKLTEMTGTDEPRDIKAHIRPPK